MNRPHSSADMHAYVLHVRITVTLASVTRTNKLLQASAAFIETVLKPRTPGEKRFTNIVSRGISVQRYYDPMHAAPSISSSDRPAVWKRKEPHPRGRQRRMPLSGSRAAIQHHRSRRPQELRLQRPVCCRSTACDGVCGAAPIITLLYAWQG